MGEQKNVQNTDPIFREKIETRNPLTGDIKEVIVVSVKPYSIKDDKSKKTFEGHTLQIEKTKFGFSGSKKSYISLDPANKQLKALIDKAYSEYENLVED